MRKGYLYGFGLPKEGERLLNIKKIESPNDRFFEVAREGTKGESHNKESYEEPGKVCRNNSVIPISYN